MIVVLHEVLKYWALKTKLFKSHPKVLLWTKVFSSKFFVESTAAILAELLQIL